MTAFLCFYILDLKDLKEKRHLTRDAHYDKKQKNYCEMVGAERFELSTSCTRNKRASQATLRPAVSSVQGRRYCARNRKELQ